MEWEDDAIVLAARPHGETGAIAELLTQQHGRHLGLVHGGASRRMRGMLQAGTIVRAQWKARLSEHLGALSLDVAQSRADVLMETPVALSGLQAAAGVLSASLAEREPHPPVFAALSALIALAGETEPMDWAAAYVAFEVGLLAELGFGLDLARCAVTGGHEDLAFVSPKSGRAVSRAAAAPYLDRLLKLPAFLLGTQAGHVSGEEVRQGLALTLHFLDRNVWRPHERAIPPARERFDDSVARLSDSRQPEGSS
ncbi:MAG: DNA repair protein RecO [Alphaproteobacteria bacterium]|nr:DNA repair protein RecO [Alphaproteobacteria bacterium]